MKVTLDYFLTRGARKRLGFDGGRHCIEMESLSSILERMLERGHLIPVNSGSQEHHYLIAHELSRQPKDEDFVPSKKSRKDRS